MSNSVTMAVFEGGNPSSELEKSLTDVRQAVLLDNLQKMAGISAINEIILATNYNNLKSEAVKTGGVIVHEISAGEFHFGRELRNLVARYDPHNLFYIGGASFPLIKQSEIEDIVLTLLSSRDFVYTNNPQSSDLVAYTPAAAINRIEPPPNDNSLAISLRDQAGLRMELVPYTPGILFDLDTPTDYLILDSGPFAGPRAKEALKPLSLNYELIDRARSILRGYYKDVAIIGRVGAPLIAHLNCNLQIRLRIFSEERGMKALGRESSGQVESLLAYLIEEAGIDKFFSYLEKVAELAFIDTRVLFAHFKLNLPAEERYFSDLGRWERLKNPWLREFTRAASECKIPVIMGGHSLVSGGLWILAEEIMQEKKA